MKGDLFTRISHLRTVVEGLRFPSTNIKETKFTGIKSTVSSKSTLTVKTEVLMVFYNPFVSVVLGYSEQNIGEGAELSVLSRLECCKK